MSFTFDGVKKDYLRVLVGLERPAWAPIEEEILEIPGRPGGIITKQHTTVRRLNIPVRIYKRGFNSLEELEEDLAAWLVTDEPKPLEFDHKPNRVYYAKVTGELIFTEYPQWADGVISFICPDPYKYGPELEAVFPSDVVTLTNNGTAEAEPVFELEVKQPVMFALIANQDDEYMMIGKEPTVEQTPFNPKQEILFEDGSTITTWATATDVDGGTVSGQFGTDGTGITVASYGSYVDGQWYGPSVMKEVPVTQDFEVEAFLQGRTPTRMHTFRVEIYMWDESMSLIGKIAVLDNSKGNDKIIAEGRVGPLSGGQYVISSSNYSHNWNQFYGLMRIRRVGKRFEFYVSRRDVNGRHVNSISRVYTDNAGKYSGRLKYIQIHIGKHGNITPSAKFFHIRAHSLRQPEEEQSPYIAYPGDTIVFDHKNADILINGESRTDLKQFGGSFFKLKKEENQLIVAPENSFEVKCSYRERFL